MSAHAMIVLCPTRPDLQGQPLLGHVGWGFQLPSSEWVIGAVEGDGWSRGNGFNGFWSRKVASLKSALQHFANMQYQDTEYNYFKLLTVTHGVFPDPDSALSVMKWVSGEKYELFGRNCMNSAYDILRAFSHGGRFNSDIVSAPELNWIPNGWYNAIGVPDSDHRWLPSPTRAVYSFLEEHDILDEVSALKPHWRDRKSDGYLAIDVEASEKAEKIVPLVASPKMSLEESNHNFS